MDYRELREERNQTFEFEGMKVQQCHSFSCKWCETVIGKLSCLQSTLSSVVFLTIAIHSVLL